ncbi:MAG: hypothetical protein ACM3N7_00670 [Planctomycetaceae bacterium]
MVSQKHDGEKMRGQEEIKPRGAGNSEGLLEEICREMKNAGPNREWVEIKTYPQAAQETDLSMRLLWESDQANQNGSTPGLRSKRNINLEKKGETKNV